MINRADSYEVIGGDTVQMEKTQRELKRMGLIVDSKFTSYLNEGEWNYDIVHLFNIQTANETWQALKSIKSRGLPFVISPIYWDPLPAWFQEAQNRRMIWAIIRKGLGYKLGYRIYSRWHRYRNPVKRKWKIQRDILASAAAILPNSNGEFNQILKDFRFKRSKFGIASIVPNAIEPQLFDPIPEPLTSFRSEFGINDFVLQVGRLSPEKNSLGLIEALWDLNVSIIFVGRPSQSNPDYVRICHERASERGSVFFVDWVPHHDLPGVYVLAAVHALPSWRETPGLASLEAAAAGCRIVSTSIGTAYEYFGDEAWYCHPADYSSIRKAVVSALNAPRSGKLRKRILENYTWEASARITLEAYEKVLKIHKNRKGEARFV